MNTGELIEKEVYDSEMNLIGTIKDLDIDIKDFTVRYLIIRLDQNLVKSIRPTEGKGNSNLKISISLIKKLGDVILLTSTLKDITAEI